MYVVCAQFLRLRTKYISVFHISDYYIRLIHLTISNFFPPPLFFCNVIILALWKVVYILNTNNYCVYKIRYFSTLTLCLVVEFL